MVAKVAIQYGIFGGPLRGIAMRRALRAAGFKVIRDSAKADIILAHSGGCFWLPKIPGHQKLLLIDPPFWPGKSVAERARSRAYSNRHYKQMGYTTRQWLRRSLVGLFYTIFAPRHNYRILQAVRHFDLATAIEGHQVTLVRNEQDDWLTPNLTDFSQQHPGARIVTLPGDHDDCWQHPQPYVDLLIDLAEHL